MPAILSTKNDPTMTPPMSKSEEALPSNQALQAKRRSAWDPRSWTWEKWLLGILICICAIIGAVVGSVLGERLNAYPDYYRIEYRLKDAYVGNSFFNNFDIYTTDDSTNTVVNLTNTPTNLSSIFTTSNTTATLRAKIALKNTTNSPSTIRISSKPTYTTGLFIFSILHVPPTTPCTTPPSLLLTNPPTIPLNNTIDILKPPPNDDSSANHIALHTTPGCKVSKNRRRRQTGEALTYNCYNGDGNSTNGDEGCAVRGPEYSAGSGFNDVGGGIYAVEVRGEGIRVWLFSWGNIPGDVSFTSAGSKNSTFVEGPQEGTVRPDPSGWGAALADFPSTECEIGRFFSDLRIVVLGDGDEGVGGSSLSQERKGKGRCGDGVEKKEGEAEEAYWEFGGFWVYEGV